MVTRERCLFLYLTFLQAKASAPTFQQSGQFSSIASMSSNVKFFLFRCSHHCSSEVIRPNFRIKKVVDPRLLISASTYRFMPEMMETTAITVITPMMTPMRVRMDRSLLATSDLKAMTMPSRKCMGERGLEV